MVLNPDGTLKNYVAGQPFPLLDPNDPQMATKLMWNFSFRPLYTDDADLRFPEIASYVGPSPDLEPLPEALDWFFNPSAGSRTMGRGLLLWILGIPLPVIILLYVFHVI